MNMCCPSLVGDPFSDLRLGIEKKKEEITEVKYMPFGTNYDRSLCFSCQ